VIRTEDAACIRERMLDLIVLTPEKLSAAALKEIVPKITGVVGVVVDAPRGRQGVGRDGIAGTDEVATGALKEERTVDGVGGGGLGGIVMLSGGGAWDGEEIAAC